MQIINQTTLRIFPEKPPVTVKHYQIMHGRADSGISLYSEYKISVMLTDGLAAVAGDRVIRTVAGDILFFRPDEIHFGRFLREGAHEFIDFYLPADFFAGLFGGGEDFSAFLEDHDKNRINRIRPGGAAGERILADAQKIPALIAREEPPVKAFLFSVLLEILCACAGEYAAQKAAPESVPPVVRIALAAINEGYARALSLREIAAKAGCSVPYLSRAFREHTGTSVYRYLTEYRLTHAKRLLRGGANVTQACFDSGFSDCSGFIRTFRKETGLTPLQYKKTGLSEERPEIVKN